LFFLGLNHVTPRLSPILFSLQGAFALSLIRAPYFACAILPYPGSFLYLFSRFSQFLESYVLPTYLLESLSPYFP
jgi:hypothetical protein